LDVKGNEIIFNASLCQEIKMVAVIEGCLGLEIDPLIWIGRHNMSAW